MLAAPLYANIQEGLGLRTLCLLSPADSPRNTHILGRIRNICYISYIMHQHSQTARLIVRFREASVVPVEMDEGRDVAEAQSRRTEARTRTVRWIESLWEGASTTAREEDQKEEVLAVFRELARESRNQGEVREYVPWQPLW